MSRSVVVVGGGIIGAAAAERLTRSGHAVTLIERGRIGGEASYAGAGILTPVHPWNYSDAMLELDARSLELWPDLAERVRVETGVDVELRRTGLLALIETADDVAEAARRVDWKRSRGESVEQLDGDGARREEPSLADDVRGALSFPEIAQVRSHRAAPALAATAARNGAKVIEQTAVMGLLRDAACVTGVRTSSGDISADVVVICAGAWTGGLLGAKPPAAAMRPARGQILLLRGRPGELRHMVLGTDGMYLVPRADGRILAGSTCEDAGFDARVTVAGTRLIADAVERMAPGLAGLEVETTWAGLRPESPDRLPALGTLEPGLVVAAGHFRSGIILAPITAEIVLDLVEGRARDDLAPFDPLRALDA